MKHTLTLAIALLTTTLSLVCSAHRTNDPTDAVLLASLFTAGTCNDPSSPSPNHGAGDTTTAPDAILVVAGQSNSIGINGASGISPQGAKIWQDGRWQSYQPKDCTGPDVMFMQRWSLDNPGKSLGLIHVGVGGTSMEDWQVHFTSSPSTGLYGSLFNRTVAIYQKVDSAIPVVAILWIQGEADTGGYVMAGAYKERTKEMFNAFSSIFKCPIVFAQVSPRDSGSFLTPAIQQYQTEIAQEMSISMVMTSDLSVREDLVHFTVDSEIEIGNRMYDALNK